MERSPRRPPARRLGQRRAEGSAAQAHRVLRSHPIQQRALQQGFRPADTAVPIRTADGTNPWTRLAEFGIQVEVPPAADPPDGPVARNLMTMWRRVVGWR